MMKYSAVLFFVGFCAVMIGGIASGDPLGKDDYLADCARCHGVDGKGGVGEMRAVRGYISVDLTQLSKKHNGKFPRQEVYHAIDGRKRFPPHFVGDMPVWGPQYQERLGPDSEEKVRRRISALVDYIESLQEK